MRDAKRKLAAIMFTDIVGYSAISSHDETLALELLEEHRDLIRPVFVSFGGKEIKTVGDGFLTEFASAIEAVECAVRIQESLAKRNESVPRQRRLQIRIGIHLGDVVESAGDVYGDGVNIAARLNHVAPPGGICVSQAIRDQILNKVPFRIVARGKRKLKNIKPRIHTYLVAIPPARTQRSSTLGHVLRLARVFTWPMPALLAGVVLLALVLGAGMHFRSVNLAAFSEVNWRELILNGDPDRMRVAVLPFSMISLNPQDEYLSDGITEELISGLSRIDQLRVLARPSVMRYKGQRKTAAEIGKELNVGTLVDGSVQKHGDELRITVQLTDVKTQENIWSQDFDGTIREMFAIQKQIATRIASHFKGRSIASLDPKNVPGNDARATPNREAYLAYLKGRYFVNKRSPDGIRQGIAALLKATQLDPEFAPAYATLSGAYGLLAYYEYLSPNVAIEKGIPFAMKALSIDKQSTEALLTAAAKSAYFDLDWKAAEARYRKAIEANPGNPVAHQWFTDFLMMRGRLSEAAIEINRTLQLDPVSLSANTLLAVQAYYARDYERAVKQCQYAIDLDSGFVVAYFWLGNAYVQLRQFDQAIAALKQAVDLSRGSPLMMSALARAYAMAGKPALAWELLKQLDEAGRKTYVSAYDVASVYAGLGETEQALGYLARARTEHSVHFPFLGVDPAFDGLRKNPRFVAVLRAIDY